MVKLNIAVDAFQSPSNPPVLVEWKPYVIDPGTKVDGEEFEAYNVRRWGSSGWTHSLKRSGRLVGANFNNWKTWPNTLKCHQMIAYLTDPNRNADNKPSTSECNAAIFDAMYECGENVSLVDTLVKIATSRLGVSDSEVNRLRTYLENDEGSREVVKEIQEGRKKYNIRGVPYFILGASQGGRYIGRPYGFSGAQDSDTFKDIFVELTSLLG
ncbi:hypothetical protein HJC23_004319 [Cyclotella cryptica]|uniref:DSBA-like thioredoxin domain-containing protein n=1 Tax=Cyclotella cryptica TaxID=29204 RepID=A0ABD3Q4G2_9STRA|eukprot:CCRYP_008941-RA/>CCRYP_008941-RA protein AED:0.43 eAED:0.43 QI:196/0.66/0.75/1/0.66/0.5/4/174/211